MLYWKFSFFSPYIFYCKSKYNPLYKKNGDLVTLESTGKDILGAEYNEVAGEGYSLKEAKLDIINSYKNKDMIICDDPTYHVTMPDFRKGENNEDK